MKVSDYLFNHDERLKNTFERKYLDVKYFKAAKNKNG